MQSAPPISIADEVPQRGIRVRRRYAAPTQLAMLLLAALACWFVFRQYTGNRREIRVGSGLQESEDTTRRAVSE